jgi:hypothetical protein
MTQLRYIDLKGQQGSWLVKATFEDGTTKMLPTAHAERLDGKTRVYTRKDDSMGISTRRHKLAAWREAIIQTGMIVLTYSEGTLGKPGLKRRGYGDIFDIAELNLEGEGDTKGATHSFKVVDRHQKLGR